MAEEKKLKLNTEQQQVVDYYGTDLLVSAGAGSGKTKVVITKLIDIIINKKVSVKNLLVTTFTKEAANQMLNKLANALADEVYLCSDEDKERILQEIDNLSECSIGTLHNFCEKIVKKYFYIIGLEPNYKILEETDGKFLKNEALEEVFEHYRQNNDNSFKDLIDIFSDKRDFVEIKNVLVSLLEFVKSKKGYEKFLEESKTELYSNFSLISQILNEYIVSRFVYIKNVYSMFLENSQNIPSPKISDYLSKTIISLSEVSLNNSLQNNLNYYLQGVFTSIRAPQTTNKLNEEEKELLNQIKNFKDYAKDEILKINEFNGFKKYDEISIISSEEIIEKIIEVLKLFNDKYRDLKRERNSLDFNDLEEYTLKILENEDVKKSLQEKYKFIFVDEYQDTNEIQEEILTKVSNGTNRIMVGDVKQSIYGFRNCSPEIFLNKYDLFNSTNQGKVINLNTNYRSQKPVLDYCNFLFSKIMTKQTNGIDYKNDAKFNVGNKDGIETSSVEVIVVENKKTQKNINLPYSIENDNESEKDESELLVLLNVIKDLLNKNVYDSEEKCYRQIKYSDIAIICKTNDTIKRVADKFLEEKIPFTTIYQYKLYQKYEVNLILSYLSLIQNDFDDINLSTCLTSVIGDLSNEDLLKIRREFLEKKYFYECVYLYKNVENELGKKVKNFYDKLNFYRQLLPMLTIKELVQRIIDDFALKTYFEAQHNGELKVKNLEVYLQTLTKGYYVQNLTSYLNFINGYAINENFSVKESGGENSITIQTMHASKGLEYNVVIVFEAENTYKTGKITGKVLTEKKLGLTLKEIDEEDNISNTLTYIAFKLSKKEDLKKEEMRLLYVALTRPKNKLIVIGQTNLEKVIKFKNDFDVLNAMSHLDLMLGVLTNNQLEKLLMHKILEINNDSKSIYKYYTNEDIVYEKEKEEDLIIKDINTFEFNNVKNFVYSDLEATNTRLKNSVTALYEEEGVNYSINHFNTKNIENTDEDALEKGNAYHFIMDKSNLDLGELENLKKYSQFSLCNEEEIVLCLKNMEKLKQNRKVLSEKMFMLYTPKSKIKKESITDSKVLVQGVADLILEGDKDIIIVDYKTTKGDENFLKKKYKTQLDIYSLATENFYKKPVAKKYIYSFYLGRLVEV